MEVGAVSNREARLRLSIRGRVQGVGFRWFLRREARALGLRGWTRNERDGSVTLEAQGPPDQLERLVAAASRGPAASRVEGVAREELAPLAAPERDFDVIG